MRVFDKVFDFLRILNENLVQCLFDSILKTKEFIYFKNFNKFKVLCSKILIPLINPPKRFCKTKLYVEKLFLKILYRVRTGKVKK